MNDITLARTVQHGPFLPGRKTRIHSAHSQDPGWADLLPRVFHLSGR